MKKAFKPVGQPCAILPEFYGETFDRPAIEGGSETSDYAVINIDGPLMDKGGFFFDGYESIKARVAVALETRPSALVLCIDSPGGLVKGAFDTARDIREMADAADVPIYVHSQGMIASAAYAIACVADYISVSETAYAGSIGIIEARYDLSAANEARGIKVEMITSGARKADGDPDTPITDEELEESQKNVDALAQMFFDLVSEFRSIDSESVAGLQARILLGPEALSFGLVDNLASRSAFFRRLEEAETNLGAVTMDEMEEMRAKLAELAESEDEEVSSQAKRMLAAMDGEEEEEEPEKPSAEEDGEEEEAEAMDEEKDSDAKAIAVRALATANQLKAELKAEKARNETLKLLASRPDVDGEMRDVIATMSPKQARKTLNAIKKPAKNPRAEVLDGNPVQGSDNGDSTNRLDPKVANRLDRAFGLQKGKLGIKNTPHSMQFGVFVPDEN